jgi:adenylyl-sulfate kinase
MIIWLIGLSGAGKTTIAQSLYEKLKPGNPDLVFLDGDNLRDVWGDSLGHTVKARNVNAHRISHLCHMLDKQGINVIAAVLSMFPEWQDWNRQNFTEYFEVYLDAPMELLRERDSKGLYAGAEAGTIDNVVGIDLPFSQPVAPELILDGDVLRQPPETIANMILKALPPKLGEA